MNEIVFGIIRFVLICLISINHTETYGKGWQDNLTVTGNITDIDGKALSGVNIQVKGSSKAVMSNNKGYYKIEGIKSSSVLIYTFIGYSNQEYTVTTNAVKNITMKLESKDIDDVVVIGYGTVKKGDVTGSVGEVNMEDIIEAPVGSFEEALAGRVAGVQVSSSDGQPGGGMDIVIRGANSLTQSNSPLFVIDGFPIENPDNAAINPEEIESINVLKDASATAIYGSRGANGVVIIQTKKGKISAPVISLNTSVGFQQVPKTIEMMTPWEFVNLQLEISRNTAMGIYTPADLDPTDDKYNSTGRTLEDYKSIKAIDWQDLVFNRSVMQNHSLAIRGGNKQTRYSVSGSFFDQNGIIINTGSKRMQGRLTLDHDFSKRFRMGMNVNYSQNTRQGQIITNGGGANFTAFTLYRAWAYRPVTGNPSLDIVESEYDDEYVNVSDVRLNPLVTGQNDYSYRYTNSLMSNFFAEFDISKKLQFKTTFSISKPKTENQNFYNSKTPQGSPVNRVMARGVHGVFIYGEGNIWSSESFVTFKNTFKKYHNVDLMAGFSVQEGYNESFGFGTQGIPDESLIMQGLQFGTPYTSTANGGEYGLLSGFGRLNYDYKSKYLVTSTFRVDGSSKFSARNRFSYFPSFAVAWNMKRERFMSDISAISESKLRISYGATGNNRIGNYDIYSTVLNSLSNTYSFGGILPPGGISISRFGNEDLKWETTKQINIGYDLSLFNRRVSFTFDYYKKTTEDLLLNADMPTSSGFERVFKNIGSLSNDGFEFTLNTTNVSNPKFTWKSSFNIAFNRNEIIELTRGQHSMLNSMSVGQNSAPLYISRIGYPAGMFFGYIFDGIYQVEDFDVNSTGIYTLKSHLPNNGSNRVSIQPGHIKYRDLNADGIIDDKDMSIIGRGQPLHVGGFANNFTFKGFYLHVFLQWSYGNQIFNANRMIFDGNYIKLFNVNQYASFNDRWTEENRSNELYKVGGEGPAGYFSNRTIEDGSYLRLKTVSLSYSIPSKYIKAAYLKKLSLRVAAQNLLTFTKYSGMDPEVSTNHSVLTPGFDYSPYPQARTITFGLNATF